MRIPDPIEILESQIETQIGMVDDEGKYPCCNCGTKQFTDDMTTISAHPAAPLACDECMDKRYGHVTDIWRAPE